jgi:SAM-dependent methyltransferase
MNNRIVDLNAERSYENLKQKTGNMPRASQSKYYWAVLPKIAEFDKICYDLITSKKILEIGCSNGEKSIKYSEFCAHVTGIDLSDLAIMTAKENSNSKTEFFCCDAHNLSFSDASFDVVIVNSFLHHLNLPMILKEIKRVLKDDGYLCAREPLGMNPLFQMYRSITPEARTLDERPFSKEDMDLISTLFYPISVNFFGFSSILSAFLRVNFFRQGTLWLDEMLAKTFLRNFYWQFSGVFRKVK